MGRFVRRRVGQDHSGNEKRGKWSCVDNAGPTEEGAVVPAVT